MTENATISLSLVLSLIGVGGVVVAILTYMRNRDKDKISDVTKISKLEQRVSILEEQHKSQSNTNEKIFSKIDELRSDLDKRFDTLTNLLIEKLK